MDTGHEGESQLSPIQPAPGGPADCSICHQPITDDYFMLNGEPWCAACHAKEGTIKPKLTFGTFMRAVLFGIGAGVLGGGLWALTTIITGYELGLVAVFVGLIVGYGIKLGGRNMGGRALQFLALVMTFYTLAFANIPIIIHVMMNDPEISRDVSGWFKEENKKIDQSRAREKAAAADEQETRTLASTSAAREDQSSSASLAVAGEDESTSAAVAASTAGAVVAKNQAPAPRKKMGFAKALTMLILLLIALVTIGPPAIYVLLIVSSPMTAVFLAIALWEAWRINRREERAFAGPFSRQEVIDFDKIDSVAP